MIDFLTWVIAWTNLALAVALLLVNAFYWPKAKHRG